MSQVGTNGVRPGFSSHPVLIQRSGDEIGRRVWPACGMVADPGLHVLGWSRERMKLTAIGRGGPLTVCPLKA